MTEHILINFKVDYKVFSHRSFYLPPGRLLMTSPLRKVGEVGDEKFIDLVQCHSLVGVTEDRLRDQLCVAEGPPRVPSSIRNFVHLDVGPLSPVSLPRLLGETGQSWTGAVRGTPGLGSDRGDNQ